MTLRHHRDCDVMGDAAYAMQTMETLNQWSYSQIDGGCLASNGGCLASCCFKTAFSPKDIFLQKVYSLTGNCNKKINGSYLHVFSYIHHRNAEDLEAIEATNPK